MVFRYEAPLFFINAPDFFTEAIDAMEPDTKVFVINMEASPNLDTTSLDTLEDLVLSIHEQGAELWLARTRHEVMLLLRKHGCYDTIGADNFFTRPSEPPWRPTGEVPGGGSGGTQPDPSTCPCRRGVMTVGREVSDPSAHASDLMDGQPSASRTAFDVNSCQAT